MPIGFDEVRICNLALSHVGSKSTLESIDEENPEGKVCKLWYDAARLVSLEAYDWSFARKSEELQAHSVDAPEMRWVYRYSPPSDMVKPRFIENPLGVNSDPVPFQMEDAGDGTSSIITNQESAALIYTYDLGDVTKFSMHFVLMMALRLGAFINSELTGKPSLGNKLVKEFDVMAIEAPNSDAHTSVPREERDAPWIRDR